MFPWLLQAALLLLIHRSFHPPIYLSLHPSIHPISSFLPPMCIHPSILSSTKMHNPQAPIENVPAPRTAQSVQTQSYTLRMIPRGSVEVEVNPRQYSCLRRRRVSGSAFSIMESNGCWPERLLLPVTPWGDPSGTELFYSHVEEG